MVASAVLEHTLPAAARAHYCLPLRARILQLTAAHPNHRRLVLLSATSTVCLEPLAVALTSTTRTGFLPLSSAPPASVSSDPAQPSERQQNCPCCHNRSIALERRRAGRTLQFRLSATTCVGPCAPKFASSSPNRLFLPDSRFQDHPSMWPLTLPSAKASPSLCDTFNLSAVSSSPPSVTRGPRVRYSNCPAIVIIRMACRRTQHCLSHTPLSPVAAPSAPHSRPPWQTRSAPARPLLSRHSWLLSPLTPGEPQAHRRFIVCCAPAAVVSAIAV